MKRLLTAFLVVLAACEIGRHEAATQASDVTAAAKRTQFWGSCAEPGGTTFFRAVCAETGDEPTALQALEAECARAAGAPCSACVVREVDAPCCWEESRVRYTGHCDGQEWGDCQAPGRMSEVLLDHHAKCRASGGDCVCAGQETQEECR